MSSLSKNSCAKAFGRVKILDQKNLPGKGLIDFNCFNSIVRIIILKSLQSREMIVRQHNL